MRTMTRGTPWKHILIFSLPILLGALFQQLYHTADTLIVGNYLGEKSLAAVGTTGTLLFLFLSAAIGFSAGNGVLVAQYFGADDEKMLRKSASTGIMLMLGSGVLLSLCGIIFSRVIFSRFLAVPPEIVEETLVYFRLCCAGLIFQFAYNIFSSILRAVGNSAATLYFLLTASVLNVVLDWLFVAIFHWGVAGAAHATNISQAVSALAAGVYMVKKYPVFCWKRQEFVWEKHLAAETVKIGFPITLQLSIVAVGLSFIQRAVNSFGAVMTAAFTVGQRIEMYLHLPCNALQTALATYSGQNIGAGKMERVTPGARQGVIISMIFTALLSVTVWALSGWLVNIFGLSEEAAEYCASYLQAVVLINIILSSYVPLFGVFQGARHCIFPVFVALTALTLRVSVTYLFKDSAIFGKSIIWWNGLFGFCIGCLLTWCFYLSGKWRKNASITGK